MFSGKNNSFGKDFDTAAKLADRMLGYFNSHVKGELKSLETVDESFIRTLDIYSGIDGVYMVDGSIGGLGIRCQTCQSKNWRTFTIRYKRRSGAITEYEKRKKEIESGYLFYPHFTAQGYFDSHGEFLGGCLALTTSIYAAIDLGLHRHQINRNDGNEFLVVGFDAVKQVEPIRTIELNRDALRVK